MMEMPNVRKLAELYPVAQKELNEELEKKAKEKIKKILREIRCCEQTLCMLRKNLSELLAIDMGSYDEDLDNETYKDRRKVARWILE